MSETKLKSLYLGKSIADLKKGFSIDDIIKGKKAKTLCTTAKKLFVQAEQHKVSGDEELSYVYYMKYLSIVTMVQGLEEHKMEWDHYKHLLGAQNIKIALDRTEELANSLEQRYELRNEQRKIEAEQSAQEEREAMEEMKRKQEEPHTVATKLK
jgi:ubiquitin carboxyl-terminal hydrolase 8